MLQHKMIPVCIFLLCINGSAAKAVRPVATAEPDSVTVANARVPAADHEKVIGSIVGTWEATQFGRQVLTTRPDGTATITMSLTSIAAVIYGRHVTLDLAWTLDGEMLTQQIVGGSPARSVEKLIAKFGDTQKFRVLETNNDQILIAKATADSSPVCWTAVALVNR